MCPLRLPEPGNPRHLRCICPFVLAVNLREVRLARLRAVKAFVLRCAPLVALLAAEKSWLRGCHFCRALRRSPFPFLHAWALAPGPGRDAVIADDVDDSSRDGTSLETLRDAICRGLSPRELRRRIGAEWVSLLSMLELEADARVRGSASFRLAVVLMAGGHEV